MARNVSFRVKVVCVWLPQEDARVLAEEIDALIWEQRSRQQMKTTEGREVVSREGGVEAERVRLLR